LAGALGRLHAFRTDSDGVLLWSFVYMVGGTGPVPSRGYTLVESRDESLLFGAETSAFGAAFGKVVMRVDAGGVPIWLSVLDGTPFGASLAGSPSLGVSVRESAVDGRVLSVNRLDSTFGFARVGLMSQQTPAGGLISTMAYLPVVAPTGTALDFAEVREAPAFLLPGPLARDLIVVGNFFTPSLGRYAVFAMRTDAGGFVIWSRFFLHPDPTASLTADGFAFDRDGDIVFSGRRGKGVLGGVAPTEFVAGKLDYATGTPL
jgi:hypothetical protein